MKVRKDPGSKAHNKDRIVSLHMKVEFIWYAFGTVPKM